MQLVFATNNSNKAKEIQVLLPKGYIVKTLSEIGCFEEIEENATTLEGNAELKATFIAQKYNFPCFADDTGLEIEALDNRPGVYSARYAGEPQNVDNNINKVLKELEGEENRKARFRTVICLIINDEKHFFEGIVEGDIGKERVGEQGFGYDSIFEPEGIGKTFAEMTRDEKNTMSHRARAFEKMVDFLMKSTIKQV